MASLLERLGLRPSDDRWWRKHARRFRESDVLTVSHTKSGRTWLRVMMSHLYHLNYGVPADELIRFDNFHRLNAAIPRMHFVRDTRFDRDRPARDFGVSPGQKLIFMLRDPRDVAVSFFFQIRHRATDRELVRKGFPADVRRMPLYDFAVDPRYGVPRVIRHFNTWGEEMPDYPAVLLVRYEDLRANPEFELERVVRFLSLPVDAEQIAATVRFASFESLRQKEQDGFFRSGKLEAADSANPDSFKVRRGEVSGYRQYFTPEQAAQLDQMVDSSLDPGFGYGAASASGRPAIQAKP
jgi:hypothetical protein